MEELKEKNLPPERHPTEEEWDNLLAILSALYRLTAAQANGMAKSSCSGERARRPQDPRQGAGEENRSGPQAG